MKIYDQVNCKIIGLDPTARRKLRNEHKYFLSYARHTPMFKSGWWDGYNYLVEMNGKMYIRTLSTALPFLSDLGYEFELEDHRPNYNFVFPNITNTMFSNKKWPENHKLAGENIVLLDHQVESIKSFSENLASVNILPTSSGKTLITAGLSHITEKYGRSIIIVPNKGLVHQTENDFINLGLDVGVFFGDRKEFDHRHTICTWQMMNILNKKSKKHSFEDTKNLNRLLSNVNTVIVDEVHQAKAKALKTLLTGPLANCPIRWGLTGTMPKEKYDNELIQTVIGAVTNKVKIKTLQDAGHISNCHINILQLKDYGGFKQYHDEKKYLVTDPSRLAWFGEKCMEISRNGNTLVLVNQIKTGQMLSEQLTDLTGNEIPFIYGGVNVAERQKQYDNIHEKNNQIILASYGVASVGISIPRIFNLVLFEPGKSFIRVIQSIGRGLRIAKDKDFVTIYDITSTCKFAKKHLTERITHYKESDYPYNIKQINWKRETGNK